MISAFFIVQIPNSTNSDENRVVRKVDTLIQIAETQIGLIAHGKPIIRNDVTFTQGAAKKASTEKRNTGALLKVTS